MGWNGEGRGGGGTVFIDTFRKHTVPLSCCSDSRMVSSLLDPLLNGIYAIQNLSVQYPFWHFKMIYLYALATIVYDASRAKTLPTNALILFMLPFLDTQSLSLLPFLVLLPFSPLHLCSPPSFFPPFLPPHPICLSLLCVVLSFGNVGSHRGLLLW